MKASHAGRIAVAAVVAAALQVIGLLRYIERLPEDWVGIGLYVITIVAFALAAFGFSLEYRRARG